MACSPCSFFRVQEIYVIDRLIDETWVLIEMVGGQPARSVREEVKDEPEATHGGAIDSLESSPQHKA